MDPINPLHFKYFKSRVDHIPLPEKFTYPFYYEPHPLSILAANELQDYLEKQIDFEHNFGLDPEQTGLIIGKMFGVLVVRNKMNELGYICAFSGKLAGGNEHKHFVPPVFDLLSENSFFKKEEVNISAINEQIEILEKDPLLKEAKEAYLIVQTQAIDDISNIKSLIKQGKSERKRIRQEAELKLDSLALEDLLEELRLKSIREQYFLKDRINHWKNEVESFQQQLQLLEGRIEDLKEERKSRSSALQKQIFEEYSFLNARGEQRSLGSIFSNTAEMKPPAGSGECAAPKLLQYAYLNHLEPIALAEFWWGESPVSEVRKHGNYYPACRGKCEPILGHMLQGIETDTNPMLENPAEGKELPIIYEDDYLLVVNKPAEFLSVPGITIKDSVYERIRAKYPDATGPLIVHRLDMSTSGILLLAKDTNTYKKLQRQFINRSVKKRYLALLDGNISEDRGIIDLPLRVDLDDRPRQLVCYEHGKRAITEWEVIDRFDNKTLVHFYPITGRTHQLRVHASHPSGLNTPILGDDLYGTKGERLHLHADLLKFKHPMSGEIISIEIKTDFNS